MSGQNFQSDRISNSVSGVALSWFASYVTGRTQSVKIVSVISKERVLTCCVTQSSDWGPQLYCDYTVPLG